MAPGEDTDSEVQENHVTNAGSSSPIKDNDADEPLEVEPNVSSSVEASARSEMAIGELTSDAKSDDPYSDEPDETLAERLWGLTEMFPESVRNASYMFATTSQSTAKSVYGFSRSLLWIVFSSSIVLFAPVIFEVERAQMEEAQRSQQKQMLLGPNTAISGGNLPLMPPVQR